MLHPRREMPDIVCILKLTQVLKFVFMTTHNMDNQVHNRRFHIC